MSAMGDLRSRVRRLFRPERTLLVMRLSDMLLVHPEQNNDHVCAECHEPVGIYPSGQAVLQRYQNVKIACQRCQALTANSVPAPGALAERGQSIRAKWPAA